MLIFRLILLFAGSTLLRIICLILYSAVVSLFTLYLKCSVLAPDSLRPPKCRVCPLSPEV